MAKKDPNPLTIEEVSIIKNFLERKIKIQEILGYINKARGNPAKNINPARIYEIRDGTVNRYLNIPAASDQMADEFLSKHSVNNDPLSDISLNKLLPIKDAQPLKLSIKETHLIECKKSFHNKIEDYLPTIAAFANNSGGYLLYGIEDKTWEVIGMQNDKFEIFDLKDLNQQIRSCFGVDLKIQSRIFTINESKIGILYIPTAEIKAIIFANQKNGISVGQIYYRYPGENRLISALDLQRIIDERVTRLSNERLRKYVEAGIEQGQ